jgi:hypothetical protein
MNHESLVFPNIFCNACFLYSNSSQAFLETFYCMLAKSQYEYKFNAPNCRSIKGFLIIFILFTTLTLMVKFSQVSSKGNEFLYKAVSMDLWKYTGRESRFWIHKMTSGIFKCTDIMRHIPNRFHVMCFSLAGQQTVIHRGFHE